jgi:hypothetical protein
MGGAAPSCNGDSAVVVDERCGEWAAPAAAITAPTYGGAETPCITLPGDAKHGRRGTALRVARHVG